MPIAHASSATYTFCMSALPTIRRELISAFAVVFAGALVVAVAALVFVVREPFQSKHSGITLTTGAVGDSRRLMIESYMPSNGVIFSDGIEADFIHFNSGAKVEISTAAQKARIISND